MSSISEWELWACAHHIIVSHGEGANAHVAERVTELAQTGDQAGVATWMAIVDRMDRLRDDQGMRQ